MVGAHDRGRAAPGDHPGGLAGQRRPPGRRARTRPSALLTTLLVTRRRRRRRGRTCRQQQRGEVVAGGAPRATPSGASDLERDSARSPDDQVDRGRGHRGGRVVVGHHQGYGAARDAGASTRGDLVGVDLVDQPAVEDARRRRGRRSGGRRPAALTSTPIEVSSCSAMPRTWAPPTMGERPTTGACVAAQRLAQPGHAEDGADRDDRVGRRQRPPGRRR